MVVEAVVLDGDAGAEEGVETEKGGEDEVSSRSGVGAVPDKAKGSRGGVNL